ncbi:MAG TPA: protein-disulfide reductase DsbD [Rudaea sp.]|jgi:thiol:disulfide interchange protein DsbD|nr:protein-disulfide reductase DsbD [Rudaea sp.]
MKLSLFSTLLALFAGNALAADADNLLPVEQAFKVETKAVDRGAVQFDFKIADDYYLYRERVKVKSNDAAVSLGALDMPPGEKKHDEFLGDVVVYHHGFTATQHLTAPADASKVSLELRYQGCHQVEPKICFPPQKVNLSIDLPKVANAASGDAPPISLGAGSPNSLLGSGPLPQEQAFKFEVIATGPADVLARFTMPKNYYLYRDKTHFTTDTAGVTLGEPKWPQGKQHTDANFGATTVYFDQIEIPIPLSRTQTDAQNVAITTTFQGCLENSVCYPEMMRTVSVPLPAGKADAAVSSAAASNESTDSQFKRALNGSIWLVFGVFFLAGLGLAFTPCVFPMIPILSGIIAGAGENLSTRRAIVLSVVYIFANAVIFTIAGVIAGLAGKNLQAAFQTAWVLWCFAGLFVLMALSMFGFYELQLPSSWQSKIANVSNQQSGGSLSGVAIMGALSALIVGPCVTPPLAVAVLYIAQKHDAVLGGFALFTLALGMGAPLVVFGASAGKLLPRAGAWMDAVKAVFGVTFLALAIWMLSRVLDATWIMLMAGLLAVASAVYLGALERIPEGASGWRTLWKALGVVLLIGGAAELIGAAAGSNDLLQPLRGMGSTVSVAASNASLVFKRVKSSEDVDRELAAAKSAGKPAMLDFYADWCVSCKEMEKFTFTKSDVQSALSNFVLLQADVTANDDTDQALMKKYGIVAPPDTLFFAANGDEKHALQLTGPEDADKFVKRIESVTQ